MTNFTASDIRQAKSFSCRTRVINYKLWVYSAESSKQVIEANSLLRIAQLCGRVSRLGMWRLMFRRVCLVWIAFYYYDYEFDCWGKGITIVVKFGKTSSSACVLVVIQQPDYFFKVACQSYFKNALLLIANIVRNGGIQHRSKY